MKVPPRPVQILVFAFCITGLLFGSMMAVFGYAYLRANGTDSDSSVLHSTMVGLVLLAPSLAGIIMTELWLKRMPR